MVTKMRLITNNPLVHQHLSPQLDTEYYPKSYREILVIVRDYLHQGHSLCSHPLSGSIKPNETPYKSVLISDTAGSPDYSNILLMEDSIITCDKFPIKYPHLPPQVDQDFRQIDYHLIHNALHL